MCMVTEGWPWCTLFLMSILFRDGVRRLVDKMGMRMMTN